MFENIIKFFKKAKKSEEKPANSKSAAKERLHLVLMQDRANVSADFLELMKQEIIEVIKKYIDVDESAIDVRLTNKENGDGTNGAPALYANIPILNIKNEARKVGPEDTKKEEKKETVKEEKNNSEKDKKAEEKVEQAEEIIEEVKTEKTDKKTKNKESKTEDKKEKTKVKEEVKSENK